MSRLFFVLSIGLIFSLTLSVLSVSGFTPPHQQVQSGGDYAIHVRTSGTYAGDGVLLPVFEALEGRYAAANEEFTIEYWFKLSSGYDSNGLELFDHHQPSREGFWTAFQNGYLWAGIDTLPESNDAALHIHTGSGFNDGQWHHYALERDLTASPQQLCLYLDGVGSCYLDGSNSQWDAVAADIRPPQNRDGDDTNNYPFYAIGGRVTGASQIEATIDEVRISDVARYRQSFTPVVTPLAVDARTVMLFHFDEGSGNKTYGLSSTGNLSLEGVLVRAFDDNGNVVLLDPGNSAEAAWLNEMWVDGRFGTTPGPPISSLNLTSPNGGELWLTDSQQQITWQTTGTAIANVSLSYSTDGFASRHTIITSTPNTGVYTWTTPLTPSLTVRVRVTDVLSSSLSDDSDANFILTDIIYPVYLPIILKDG